MFVGCLRDKQQRSCLLCFGIERKGKMDNFNKKVLIDLKASFELQVDDDSSDANNVTLRSTFDTKERAFEFLKRYSEITNTEWIVWRNLPSPQRVAFHQKWVCQHNQRHKSEHSRKRNINCKASVDILIKKINKGTKKNDAFLKLTPPLPALIKLNVEHSHSTSSTDSLRMLRVGEEVKQQFFEYFKDGMSPSEAIKFHEGLLKRDEASYDILANAAINPSARQVYHLYDSWKLTNLGSTHDPFDKLDEKSEFYKDAGDSVFIKKDAPWAVLVTTSVMKRAQELESAKEIIFLDSTASCESSGCSLTVMLTATKAGAIPIAVFIHQNQTAECYESAFALFQKHFPCSFAGDNAPAIFMTDDSASEKLALQTFWPSSVQLLSHFHVAHAEWRYLWGRNVPNDKRSFLMQLFQKVMYSKTEEEFQYAVQEILEIETQFPGFVKRFKAYLKRKKEWVFLYRQHLISGHHSTILYAEATMRILKDVILCQTKSFNIVALTEFCISIWDKYLVKKLLDYAYNKNQKPQLIYNSLTKKIDGSTVYVKGINEYTYVIQNQGKNVKYTIDAVIGVCSCFAGRTGAFCKHQCFLHTLDLITLPRMLPLTPDERHELGKLALGQKCPALTFFQEMKDTPSLDSPMHEDPNDSPEEDMETDQVKGELQNEVVRWIAVCNGEFPQKHVQQMVSAMKKIRTKSQILSALQKISELISAKAELSTEAEKETFNQHHEYIMNQYNC